ncbi:MAG: hypothetical protein KatS3mg035_0052 [Bacteroidia bacterium]|nr:MAG: hypothetical protein KatS3mg035_0052 [Bacteroidia bacterium]
MDKFQNKYRIPSTRLQNWDYRWAGAYFITICTHNRKHYFGEIHNGKMELSHIGIIADILWYEIPYHAQNVELGAFVVMPNHVHGIIIITNDNDNNNTVPVVVETLHATSLPPLREPSSEPKNEQMSKISPKPHSISTIVRSYKSAVTKHARRLGFEFQWQSRFYDHIIRNDEAFQKITRYINNNPINWKEDKFFKF